MTKEDYRSKVDTDKRTLQDECSSLQDEVQTMNENIGRKSYFSKYSKRDFNN